MAGYTDVEQQYLDHIGEVMAEERQSRAERVAACIEAIERAPVLTQEIASMAIGHFLDKADPLDPFRRRTTYYDNKIAHGNIPGMLLVFSELYTSLYATGEFIGWSDFMGAAKMIKGIQPYRLAERSIDRLWIQTTLRNPEHEPDIYYERNLLPSGKMRHTIMDGEFPSKSALFHHEVVEAYLTYLRTSSGVVPNLPDAVICMAVTDNPELLERVVPKKYTKFLLDVA